MVYYNVSMQHTEKTFEKLAHMQYDLFCRSNLIVRSVLGMGAVVLGVVNFSEWWGVLLIAYGSFLASGRYNSANHTAHKLARQIRDSGMDFPASRYVFRENAFEIIPLPENANGECLAYADWTVSEMEDYLSLTEKFVASFRKQVQAMNRESE